MFTDRQKEILVTTNKVCLTLMMIMKWWIFICDDGNHDDDGIETEGRNK